MLFESFRNKNKRNLPHKNRIGFSFFDSQFFYFILLLKCLDCKASSTLVCVKFVGFECKKLYYNKTSYMISTHDLERIKKNVKTTK